MSVPPLMPWLCDAVKTKCCNAQDAYKDGALAQALDVARAPNPVSGGINCVLSDRTHSIGAVLTTGAVSRWQQAMPTYDVSQLNSAILIIDKYDITLNEHTLQFTLRVQEFHWLTAAAEMIGHPECIMADAVVRSLFEAAIVPLAQGARTSMNACTTPGARTSTGPYLLHLQRRCYPMARACFPVQALPPNSLMIECIAIPEDQQVSDRSNPIATLSHALKKSPDLMPL